MTNTMTPVETRKAINTRTAEWRAAWHLGSEERRTRALAVVELLRAMPVAHDQIPHDVTSMLYADAGVRA